MAIVIIIGVLLIAGLAFLVVWKIRTAGFRPDPDKQRQQERLNADLQPTGFAYERRGDYFYSLMDCWQREAGYCRLYDEGAPLFNMVMDCEPVAFYYGGKRWLIELWKGQYGITTGAEIGIYNTTRPDLNTAQVSGTFFESASDQERLQMGFVLRKNGTVLLKRKALHWWLASFRLGEFSEPGELAMQVKIKFPNREMCGAFVESLQKLGYRRGEYAVLRTTVRIQYGKPHSPQPFDEESAHISLVQELNKNNCALLNTVTEKYPDTLDRLQYLKTAMPELYDFLFHSLYAKGFFGAFEIIRQALREQDENRPRPEPPAGCHPCPCVCPPKKPPEGSPCRR